MSAKFGVCGSQYINNYITNIHYHLPKYINNILTYTYKPLANISAKCGVWVPNRMSHALTCYIFFVPPSHFFCLV